MTLHSLVLKIRHSKYLKKIDFIWNLLRKPYGFIIDPFNKGIPLVINEDTTVRLPLKFYSKNIANYEKEPTKYLTTWIRNNPNSLVIDIGTAIGYISSIALHSSKNVNVIGIDSDIMSLKICEWICSYAADNRFRKLQCFITDETSTSINLSNAIAITKDKLALIDIKDAIKSNTYQVLGESENSEIPLYTLDVLFESENIDCPVLIKCDIEGAEILAISGAKKFISKFRPQIAVSVHPELLLNYNSSSAELKKLIESFGYTVMLISIDHEEHWWCSPIN